MKNYKKITTAEMGFETTKFYMHIDLYNFLKSKEILSSFVYNVNTKYKNYQARGIGSVTGHKVNDIIDAFAWALTKQKFHYWHAIHKEFELFQSLNAQSN